MHLSPGDVCPLWAEHRGALLRAWIEDHPGTRPQSWWRHDAPREPQGTRPGWFIDAMFELPRQRLGGIGTASWEVLDVQPVFHLGIPFVWVTPGK